MNRKKKKLKYIRIKNTWRSELKHTSIIDITVGTQHNFHWNPRYPLNKIVMDFKRRDEIIKYGVVKVGVKVWKY